MKNWLISLIRYKKKLINIILIFLVSIISVIGPMAIGIKYLVFLNKKIELTQDINDDKDDKNTSVNVLKHLTNNYLGIINILNEQTILNKLKELNPLLKIDQIKVKNISYTCCTIFAKSDSYYNEFEKQIHYQFKNQFEEKQEKDFEKIQSKIKFTKIENLKLIDFDNKGKAIINQDYFKAIMFKKILKMKPRFNNPSIIFSFDVIDNKQFAKVEYIGYGKNYWIFKILNCVQ